MTQPKTKKSLLSFSPSQPQLSSPKSNNQVSTQPKNNTLISINHKKTNSTTKKDVKISNLEHPSESTITMPMTHRPANNKESFTDSPRKAKVGLESPRIKLATTKPLANFQSQPSSPRKASGLSSLLQQKPLVQKHFGNFIPLSANNSIKASASQNQEEFAINRNESLEKKNKKKSELEKITLERKPFMQFGLTGKKQVLFSSPSARANTRQGPISTSHKNLATKQTEEDQPYHHHHHPLISSQTEENEPLHHHHHHHNLNSKPTEEDQLHHQQPSILRPTEEDQTPNHQPFVSSETNLFHGSLRINDTPTPRVAAKTILDITPSKSLGNLTLSIQKEKTRSIATLGVPEEILVLETETEGTPSSRQYSDRASPEDFVNLSKGREEKVSRGKISVTAIDELAEEDNMQKFARKKFVKFFNTGMNNTPKSTSESTAEASPGSQLNPKHPAATKTHNGRILKPSSFAVDSFSKRVDTLENNNPIKTTTSQGDFDVFTDRAGFFDINRENTFLGRNSCLNVENIIKPSRKSKVWYDDNKIQPKFMRTHGSMCFTELWSARSKDEYHMKKIKPKNEKSRGSIKK